MSERSESNGGNMNCPKCGKELINVNGKYVCADCGIEVPENEAVSQANQAAPAPITDPPLPQDISVDATVASSSAPDEPVASEPPKPEDSIPPIPEPTVSTFDSSVPISEMQSSPKGSPEGATSEITENSLPSSSPDLSQAPAVSIPVTNAEEPLSKPLEPSAQIPELPQTESPAPTENPVAVDPYETAYQDGPVSSPANLSGPTPSVDTLQPNINPTAGLGSSTPPAQPDPAIFQDPMYDTGANPTESSQAPAPNQAAAFDPMAQTPTDQPVDDTKKLKIILFLGIILAVLLLVGGIVAYFLLT